MKLILTLTLNYCFTECRFQLNIQVNRQHTIKHAVLLLNIQHTVKTPRSYTYIIQLNIQNTIKHIASG